MAEQAEQNLAGTVKKRTKGRRGKQKELYKFEDFEVGAHVRCQVSDLCYYLDCNKQLKFGKCILVCQGPGKRLLMLDPEQLIEENAFTRAEIRDKLCPGTRVHVVLTSAGCNLRAQFLNVFTPTEHGTRQQTEQDKHGTLLIKTLKHYPVGPDPEVVEQLPFHQSAAAVASTSQQPYTPKDPDPNMKDTDPLVFTAEEEEKKQEDKDDDFYNRSVKPGEKPAYGQKGREGYYGLPMHAHMHDICQLLRYDHRILVVQGETGCGKTRVIPPMAARFGFDRVACTEPRQLAATMVCQSLKEEMNYKVGYHVRFDNRTTARTKVTYMTEGIMVNEILGSPNMQLPYDLIMLDEVHEMSENLSLILALLPKVFEANSNLKVILASATANVEKLCAKFQCPSIKVKGRTYPIEQRYLNYDMNEQTIAVLKAIMQVDEEHDDRKHILAFLPEIRTINYTVSDLEHKFAKSPRHKIYGLYSQQDKEVKDDLSIADLEHRHIVVSTNVAETSITIEGVGYVVDYGWEKNAKYDVKTGITIMSTDPITKGSAKQRAGRAGRMEPGICYRLYTKDAFENMADCKPPAILNCDISSIMLNVMCAGLKMEDLNWMDRPSDEAFQRAYTELFVLGALYVGRNATDPSQKQYNVSDFGRNIARLGTTPRIGAMLLHSISLDCIEETLIAAAIMSLESFYQKPKLYQCHPNKIKELYGHFLGELPSLIVAYLKYFNGTPSDRNKMNEHGFTHRNMWKARDMKINLERNLRRNKIYSGPITGNVCLHPHDFGWSEREKLNFLPFLRIFSKCFVQNAALKLLPVVKANVTYKMIVGGKTIKQHQRTINEKREEDAIVAGTLIKTADITTRDWAVVNERWIEMDLPKLYESQSLSASSFSSFST